MLGEDSFRLSVFRLSLKVKTDLSLSVRQTAGAGGCCLGDGSETTENTSWRRLVPPAQTRYHGNKGRRWCDGPPQEMLSDNTRCVFGWACRGGWGTCNALQRGVTHQSRRRCPTGAPPAIQVPSGWVWLHHLGSTAEI